MVAIIVASKLFILVLAFAYSVMVLDKPPREHVKAYLALAFAIFICLVPNPWILGLVL